MSNNENKYKLLGEPHGTAVAKLKKSLLFKFVKELNLDTCFRCGEKIDDISNFSIEHKIDWQSAKNPIETFYDLDNIAFSHLKCNIVSANKHVPHPSAQGEKNYNAKLTNEIVANIKKDLREGMIQSDIVKKYSVDKRTISEINAGVSWKYVE